MRNHPITLGVIRPSWSANKARTFGTITPEARETIFKRDDYTCQCCGFRAEKYQEILHINGDKRDFSKDNVLTTCIFCHQCFDLGQVEQMDSGMLIWLPEISQAKLHHITRAIYLARVTQVPLAGIANKINDTFFARGEAAKKILGSTDPGALAIVMKDFLTKKDYEQAQANIKGIRLFPLPRRMIPDDTAGFVDMKNKVNFFPQILVHWRSKIGPYHAMPAQEWPELFKTLDLTMPAELRADAPVE